MVALCKVPCILEELAIKVEPLEAADLCHDLVDSVRWLHHEGHGLAVQCLDVNIIVAADAATKSLHKVQGVDNSPIL